MNFIRALLLVGVCALVVTVESAPKYSKALQLVKQAQDTLYNMVHFNTPEENALTDPKRNYVLLVGFLFDLVRALEGLGPFYENTYFPVLDKALPTYWKDPEFVEEKVLKHIELLNQQIAPVVMLIKKYCNHSTTVKCDEAVDLEVKANSDEYMQPAKSLLLAGELAQKYLEDTYEELAINKQIVTFLLTKGMNELVDIVYKGVNLIRSWNI